MTCNAVQHMCIQFANNQAHVAMFCRHDGSVCKQGRCAVSRSPEISGVAESALRDGRYSKQFQHIQSRNEKKGKEKKRKENTTPFGVSLMRSQMFYQAAQGVGDQLRGVSARHIVPPIFFSLRCKSVPCLQQCLLGSCMHFIYLLSVLLSAC